MKVTGSISTKFVQISDELEPEDFYEKDLQKCKRQNSIQKQEAHWTILSDVSKGSFEDMQNNVRNLKTFLFQVHQVLQDLQDLARINIIP